MRTIYTREWLPVASLLRKGAWVCNANGHPMVMSFAFKQRPASIIYIMNRVAPPAIKPWKKKPPSMRTENEEAAWSVHLQRPTTPMIRFPTTDPGAFLRDWLSA